ncbi:MAG: acetyl-CoA C-acetyltransferase [Clostridiaceae bacterium]
MSKVFIAAAKRTPVGSFQGMLKSLTPADMAAVLVKAILEETKLPKEAVDEVIVGNILPAGQGQGIARQVAIKGGLPIETPAYSINIACGSGMKAVMNASAAIKSGYADLIIAGGTESMSNAPYILPKEIRGGIKMGEFSVKDHMLHDALTDAFTGIHMGITAENIAEKYNISREMQDLFAIESQRKAIEAQDNGRFKEEIIPIEAKVGRENILVTEDEYINRKTTLEKLSTLRPAFKKDGTVTAGNASGINDGASIMLIASEGAIEKYSLTPLVELVGIGQGGVAPELMGLGPTPAIKKALEDADLTLKDMDLIELNEAFAAQSLGVIKELSEEYNISEDELKKITNVNGGAIALGHPVGASGNRIMVTLIYEMIRRKSLYGAATLCIGGGMGTAVVLKNANS